MNRVNKRTGMRDLGELEKLDYLLTVIWTWLLLSWTPASKRRSCVLDDSLVGLAGVDAAVAAKATGVAT